MRDVGPEPREDGAARSPHVDGEIPVALVEDAGGGAHVVDARLLDGPGGRGEVPGRRGLGRGCDGIKTMIVLIERFSGGIGRLYTEGTFIVYRIRKLSLTPTRTRVKLGDRSSIES